MTARARVALDALTELGNGSRAGAAEVLGELFVLDPALLRESLAASLRDELQREDLLLHGPWVENAPHEFLLFDTLRGYQIARVWYDPEPTARRWFAQVEDPPGAVVYEAAGDSGEEVRRACVDWLRGQGWHQIG